MTARATGSSPPVAVAVVSWNTRQLLAACLDSLRPESEAGSAEVWVVDNASRDGSAELVRESYPWVRLIASPRNLGFGPAVNQVAARTTGEWIAAANADVALEPGALAALLAEGGGEPRAGILAPRLRTSDDSTQHSVHRFPGIALSAVVNLGLARLVPGLGDRWCLEGHWDPERPRRVDWAHGAFLLVRREAFESAGGFDPAQFLYAEDLDLAWRLAAAGWSTRYVPQAVVRHRVSAATERAFGAARLERFMAASYDWLLRRRGRGVALAYAAINLAGGAVHWLIEAALAAVRRSRAPRRDLVRAYVAAHRRGLRAALAGREGDLDGDDRARLG